MSSVQRRRASAKARLESQLKKGTKPMKSGEGTTINPAVSFKGEEPLTEKDVERIKKEIAILNNKL